MMYIHDPFIPLPPDRERMFLIHRWHACVMATTQWLQTWLQVCNADIDANLSNVMLVFHAMFVPDAACTFHACMEGPCILLPPGAIHHPPDAYTWWCMHPSCMHLMTAAAVLLARQQWFSWIKLFSNPLGLQSLIAYDCLSYLSQKWFDFKCYCAHLSLVISVLMQ